MQYCPAVNPSISLMAYAEPPIETFNSRLNSNAYLLTVEFFTDGSQRILSIIIWMQEKAKHCELYNHLFHIISSVPFVRNNQKFYEFIESGHKFCHVLANMIHGRSAQYEVTDLISSALISKKYNSYTIARIFLCISRICSLIETGIYFSSKSPSRLNQLVKIKHVFNAMGFACALYSAHQERKASVNANDIPVFIFKDRVIVYGAGIVSEGLRCIKEMNLASLAKYQNTLLIASSVFGAIHSYSAYPIRFDKFSVSYKDIAEVSN